METILTIKNNFIERDNNWIDVATELYKIKQHLKDMEALEAKLTKQLQAMSEGVSSRGGNFIYTTYVRKGTVDYTAIPELQGVNLELYRKQHAEYWKLEVRI